MKKSRFEIGQLVSFWRAGEITRGTITTVDKRPDGIMEYTIELRDGRAVYPAFNGDIAPIKFVDCVEALLNL